MIFPNYYKEMIIYKYKEKNINNNKSRNEDVIILNIIYNKIIQSIYYLFNYNHSNKIFFYLNVIVLRIKINL